MLLVGGVDLVAPLARLLIQIFPTGEGPSGEEVSLDKAERSLYTGGAIGVAQLMCHESEPETVAESFHLRYGDHLSSSTTQHYHMRVVDHHASRGPREVTQCLGQKYLAVETSEGRIALEEQHPRITQNRRRRLHLSFPFAQFDFVWRG